MTPNNDVSTVNSAEATRTLRRRRSHQTRPEIDTGLRFAAPYFAHETLNPELYRKNTRAPIGGPSLVEEAGGESEYGSAAPSSDEEEGPHGPHSVYAGKKRSHSKGSTRRERKKVRVEGGRPAIPKKVVADLDSDDQIIVRMKEQKYTDIEIRDHLISEGRTNYNAKTISSRWGRLRRVLEARADELLDEKLIDWHAGEDELLLQSVNKASAEVNFRKKKIESRKWKLVADYLKESKPTANYSKNACKMRFEALENGTATIPPELDDDPEKRAAETAARLQEKQDKARAEEERKEDLANEAAMQEANAVNTCSARSRATGQIEVVRSPTVSPPHVNPDDAMFEAQGFSTQNSALTFVHPAAAASVTNIAKTVKSTSLGKDPLQPKKHTKAKLPKQDASSKTKAIQGASTTINSAPSSSKAVKIHKASKAPKVKFPASGRKANPTTNSGESVVTPKKPKVTAAKEPEATSTSVTEPPGDPPGPSFVKDTPQVSVEPLKGTKTAEATKATQGDLPKQTSTPPALSSSKRLALTLAKSFRADWTYKQRKAELRTRKLVQYGSKQDLSDRLDAADEANAARSVTTSSPGGLPDTIKTATTNISTVTPNAKAGPSKAIPKSTVSVSTSTISKGVAKSSTPGDLPKTTASNEPAKVKKPHKTASTQVAGPSATKPTVSVAMGTGSPRSTASSTDAVVKDSKPVDHKRSSGTTHTAPGPSRITQPTSSISSNPITGGRRLEISHLPRDINEDILRNFFREYPIASIDSRCFPVGIAFVDLTTNALALRAVNQLSGKQLNQRIVKLQIVRTISVDADED